MCIKRFLLLLSSNDVSVYIADNEDSFEFSPKLNSINLATDTEAEPPHFD